MRVAEVMSRGFDPVDPSATVQEAATRMAELDVGAVLVGTEESLEGILTDRDIILRLVVDGRSPAEVPVREIMSSSVFSCKEDDTVESVLAQMRERQIRRMPVLGEDGRPSGIVAMSDLAKAVSGPEQIKETLREISEPHRTRKTPPPPREEPAAEEDASAGDQAVNRR
jgi:CBS domain-containing protein